MENKYVVTRMGDVLCHKKKFKYIKKVKKNGKWRYYYNIKELKKDIKNVVGIEAKNNLERDEKNLSDFENELKDLRKQYENALISKKDYEMKAARLESAYRSKSLLTNVHGVMLTGPSEKVKQHNEEYNSMRKEAFKNKRLADTNSKLANIENDKIRDLERSMVDTQKVIDQIKKSSEMNKSIYDRSIVGAIDKGKNAVENLLRKLKSR